MTHSAWDHARLYCRLVLLISIAAIASASTADDDAGSGTCSDAPSGCPGAGRGALVLTGANRGIGFEAVVQLATARSFSKYILTVRSADKGSRAVAAAARASGRPASEFEFVVMDLVDTASVVRAVDSLPDNINALVMNAGALGMGDTVTADNVTWTFAANVLGHVTLAEGLLDAGKLAADDVHGKPRVIFAGSEMARPVWAMTGFQAPPVMEPGKLEGYMRHPPLQGTWGVGVRIMHAAYGSSKTIGGLWLSQLAQERTDVYFATVSPGGTMDTDAMHRASEPLRTIASFAIMQHAFGAMGMTQSLETCAKRYVAALTEDDFPARFPSGAVLGAPSSMFPFHLGAAGPLTDQLPIYPTYGDAALQKEAAQAVRAKMRASRAAMQ